MAERARGLQRESENIVHRLEEAIAGITAAANREGERPAGRPLEREDVEAAEPARRRRSAPPSGVGAEEALLRATQMAIRGSRRAEIEAMLGDEFGVANPAEIVDQILGVGRR